MSVWGYTAGMSDLVTAEGKELISSKRASELSGYSQDYIGQLARGGHISAQRVEGLWYISMESLESYKVNAEAYKPEPPIRKQVSDPDSLISFDGKDYVSAARAAKITGYHQDYVGQLARTGTLMARQVGNRWYVERDAILAHKKEKDSLLAAVQRESVGLLHIEPSKSALGEKESTEAAKDDYFTYTSDAGDLIPVFGQPETIDSRTAASSEEEEKETISTPIPVHVVPQRQTIGGYAVQKKSYVGHRKPKVRIHGKTISYAAAGVMAFTIVIVLMFGFSTIRTSSMYAAVAKSGDYTRGIGNVIGKVGDLLEMVIVPELIYHRAQ